MRIRDVAPPRGKTYLSTDGRLLDLDYSTDENNNGGNNIDQRERISRISALENYLNEINAPTKV